MMNKLSNTFGEGKPENIVTIWQCSECYSRYRQIARPKSCPECDAKEAKIREGELSIQ